VYDREPQLVTATTNTRSEEPKARDSERLIDERYFYPIFFFLHEAVSSTNLKFQTFVGVNFI
jgi:disulfide oxidoreductase YuzD